MCSKPSQDFQVSHSWLVRHCTLQDEGVCLVTYKADSPFLDQDLGRRLAFEQSIHYEFT